MIEFPLIAVTHARVHEIDVPRSLYLNSNSIKNEKDLLLLFNGVLMYTY